MSTMTPADLERSVENLRGIVAALAAEVERSRARLAAVKARLSHHQHDYTRDVTGKPTTFTPATHTHAYASSTHAHNYQDRRFTLTDDDVARTTDVPREP